MKFIKTEGTAELAAALADALNAALAKSEPVLWLVPGGSNTQVATSAMAQLNPRNLAYLTVMLTDERFGPPGHKDSNYEQLKNLGFNYGTARFINVLEAGDVKAVRQQYNDEARKHFNEAKMVIGFFGMGPDGHVAGILPFSPPTVSGKIWVENYETDPFVRVTLTPFALSHVATAFVGAYGAEKLMALQNLHDKMLSIKEQPAQLLHHIPKVYIYNDQLGDV